MMDHPYTMLIVDDKEVDRNGICYLLRQYDLPVTPLTASSGQEALAILDQREVHILFTDIKMPGMTGLELIEQALQRQPHVQVIIFSSYENFDYAHQAMGMGVTQYLLKPIRIDKFLACMQRILEALGNAWKNQTETLYYTVLTDRLSSEELDRLSQAASPFSAGAALLLDFADPFFKQNHLDLFKEGDTDILSVPLNEYQCAYIARTEPAALSAVQVLQAALETIPDRYVLIYGGEFSTPHDLQQIGAQMESYGASKFYIADSTFINLKELPQEVPDLDLRQYFKRGAQIGKLLIRKELKSAEEEIDAIFRELQQKVFMPTSIVKHICGEIVRGGLDENLPDYDDILMQTLLNIEQSHNIEDLKNICMGLVSQHAQQDDETKAIDQALEIIHREYMNNISLESVATNVYLSACYFSYLFKKTTGMNFIKYLTSYRVEVAKNLLRTTRLKIGNICEMVGYSNVSYFCQIFKNHCGMTPAQFRGSKL